MTELLSFPKPVVDDDTEFVRTLVWTLERARAGKIKGYAIFFIVDGDDGERTIEASKSFDEYNTHSVLGGIERMKMNYMARTWPKDNETEAS